MPCRGLCRVAFHFILVLPSILLFKINRTKPCLPCLGLFLTCCIILVLFRLALSCLALPCPFLFLQFLVSVFKSSKKLKWSEVKYWAEFWVLSSACTRLSYAKFVVVQGYDFIHTCKIIFQEASQEVLQGVSSKMSALPDTKLKACSKLGRNWEGNE